MPSSETIALVALAGLLLSITPGPSMFYVASRSLGQNTSAGLVSAVGLATGGIVHAFAAAAGLSALIAYWPSVYRGIAILGAGYLIYLGVRMYLSRHDRLQEIETVGKASLTTIYCQGVMVEVLNPKTALFFLAFLPQFISQDANTFVIQALILGLLVPLTAVPSDVVVAFAAGTLAKKLSQRAPARAWLNAIAAAFLVVLGLRVLFSGVGPPSA